MSEQKDKYDELEESLYGDSDSKQKQLEDMWEERKHTPTKSKT